MLTKKEVYEKLKLNKLDGRYDIVAVNDKGVELSAASWWDADATKEVTEALGTTTHLVYEDTTGCESCGYGSCCVFFF